MRAVADGVWQLAGIVPHLINTYLVRTTVGDVLVDTGTRWVTGTLLRELRGVRLSLVALTHVHPDHQGSAAAVCHRFGVPLACHEADAAVMEGRAPMQPRSLLVRTFDRIWSGPPHPVAVRWQGGETIGEWRVVHTPGHTAGHVTFFRERDRVAIVGDVIRNASLRTWFGRMSETPHVFSVDPAQNRRSMRTVLDLQPRLLLFGHGPPSTRLDELERLVRQVESA